MKPVRWLRGWQVKTAPLPPAAYSIFPAAERLIKLTLMNRAEASEKIKDHCKTIALEMMDLNPAITHLDDEQTQEALFEASYELTKQLEIIKKRVIKLERRNEPGENASTGV